MRVHLQTHGPDQPFYFGFDPTPHFATVSLAQPQVLFLSKGLKLAFRSEEVLVRGGPNLEIALKVESGSELSGDSRLAQMVDLAERTVDAEIMAIQNPMTDVQSLQPFLQRLRMEIVSYP
jgi:hypothetical protein